MAANDQIPPSMKIKVDIEPTILVVGERHVKIHIYIYIYIYKCLRFNTYIK